MKSRTITFTPELEAIIKRCETCVVAMTDPDGFPYALPMNFGWNDGVVYLHSAPQGKKIDFLKAKPEVCLVFSADHQLRWQNSEIACSYSMKYRSVLIFGKVEFIEDFEEKESALDSIMQQYGAKDYKYSEPAIRNVCVMKIAAKKIEGRVYGY